MKENFYVFLDIDGVLWDEQFIDKLIKNDVRERENDSLSNYFKPSSMDALNFLIDNLKQNFEVVLVISSTRRIDMPKITEQLKSNGLIEVSKIDRTAVSLDMFEMDRGLEIINYLVKHNNSKNYCVIDDEVNDITPYIEKEHIIKTSDQKALHQKQVIKFLKRLNFNKENEQIL